MVLGEFPTEPAVEKTLSELAVGDLGGGYVDVSGVSGALGMGVAEFLARVPAERYPEDSLEMTRYPGRNWSTEELIPKGLLELRDGRYVRTERAETATYHFRRMVDQGGWI